MMIAQQRSTAVVGRRPDHDGKTMMMVNIANTISSGKEGCERIRIKLERLQESKMGPSGNVSKSGPKGRTAPLLRQRMQDLREEFEQMRKNCENRISDATDSCKEPCALNPCNDQMDDLFSEDFRFEELERALFELNLALNEDEDSSPDPSCKDKDCINKMGDAAPVPYFGSGLNKVQQQDLDTTLAEPEHPISLQPNCSSMHLGWYVDADNKWWGVGAFLGIVLFDWHGVLLVLFGCLWTGGLCLQHVKTT